MICTTEQKPEPILSSLKELDTRRFLITKARIMDAGYGHTFFLGMTHEPTKKEGTMVTAGQHQMERTIETGSALFPRNKQPSRKQLVSRPSGFS